MTAISLAQICWSIFTVLMVITVLTSAAYYYHWGRYSMTHAAAISTIAVYTFGMALIVLFLFSALAAI